MKKIYDIKDIKKEDKKIFIALSADYGNVGDMAITIAQEKILHDAFPDRKIIDIPMNIVYEFSEELKPLLNQNDIFTIIGGGNLGNLYLAFEKKRRFVIKTFKDYKTVSFPQSAAFTEDNEGNEELKNSVNDYSTNSNLDIFMREQKSYNIMKNNFKNPVHLIPDTVFYLKEKIDVPENITRENITICLRNDREKINHSKFNTDLASLLKSNGFKDILMTDTHIGEVTVKPEERQTIFDNLMKKFYSSKVIITDRLHGLIFSIITNTPCIALDNSNKKISSTYYTWLEKSPLIKFLPEYNEEKFLQYVNELSAIQNPKIDLYFSKEFNELFECLKK